MLCDARPLRSTTKPHRCTSLPANPSLSYTTIRLLRRIIAFGNRRRGRSRTIF
ncbi:MAG: hypothetical protein J6031_05470 [Bacteroidales bacterium]|nr:hypothetical protein [Bacteroidales bacterium]